MFDASYVVSAWKNWLVCLECAPLAYLMLRSYPASELMLDTLNAQHFKT